MTLLNLNFKSSNNSTDKRSTTSFKTGLIIVHPSSLRRGFFFLIFFYQSLYFVFYFYSLYLVILFIFTVFCILFIFTEFFILFMFFFSCSDQKKSTPKLTFAFSLMARARRAGSWKLMFVLHARQFWRLSSRPQPAFTIPARNTRDFSPLFPLLSLAKHSVGRAGSLATVSEQRDVQCHNDAVWCRPRKHCCQRFSVIRTPDIKKFALFPSSQTWYQ